MEGNIKDIEIESDSEIEESEEEEKFETAADRKKKNDEKKSVFSMFKLVKVINNNCWFV